MAGDTEQLSISSEGLDFMAHLSGCDDVSALYPELPSEYFEQMGDVFTDQERERPGGRIRPFFRRRDLNNDPKNGPFEDNRPKPAWEIGVNISF